MTTITIDRKHHHNGLYNGRKQLVLPTELQFAAAYQAAGIALGQLSNADEVVETIMLYFFQALGGRDLWLKFEVKLAINVSDQVPVRRTIYGEHTWVAHKGNQELLAEEYAATLVESIQAGAKELAQSLRAAAGQIERSAKKVGSKGAA